MMNVKKAIINDNANTDCACSRKQCCRVLLRIPQRHCKVSVDLRQALVSAPFGEVKPGWIKLGVRRTGCIEHGPHHEQAVSSFAAPGVSAEPMGEANPLVPHQLTTNAPDVGNAPTKAVLNVRRGTCALTASSGEVSLSTTRLVSMS